MKCKSKKQIRMAKNQSVSILSESYINHHSLPKNAGKNEQATSANNLKNNQSINGRK